MPAPPSVEGTSTTSSAAALSGVAPLWRRGLILLGAGLLFWAIAVVFQMLGGAYRSELSGYPDEPAHYVTALMIRDYLTSGQWAHPIAFAENYYLHYPKVAFGMWGPGLHVLGASWMLLFSGSRVSILLLMALITTGIATTIFGVAQRIFGWLPALLLGTLAILLPEVQRYTAMVMADNLVALFDLWAAVCFARFLDTQSARYSWLFGACAAVSILCKGNGIALVLLPALALLLTRRWELLKIRAFWYPAIVVLVFAGPWQYYSSSQLAGIMSSRRVGADFALAYARGVVHLAGPAIFVLALVGIWATLFRAGRPRGTDGVWVALAALLAAVVLFHIVTPSAGPESRYLIAVAAPLLLFAAAGVVYLAEFLPRSMPFGARVAIPALLALAIFFAQRFEIPQKPHRGFRELAHDLLGREDDPVMLISSTSSGEGLLVSEVAMQAAHRFDHWVLRAGKVLAVSDWNADHYRPLQHSQAEVAAFLESIPVSLVVIDLDAPDPVVTHHQMLQDTLRARPERWRLLGRYPENAPTIDVYEMLGSEKTPRGKIRVDLPYTLGRPIER